MIARFAKGFGTILMIVPARVIEEPRRILRAVPAGIEVNAALSILEQVKLWNWRRGAPFRWPTTTPGPDDGQMPPFRSFAEPNTMGQSMRKIGIRTRIGDYPNLSWP